MSRSAPIRARTLLLLGALLVTTTSCAYFQAAGRSIGESLGLVTPPPERQGYGEPVRTTGPVEASSQAQKR